MLIVLQWQWVPVGQEGKQGRVYTFPLTFGPAPQLNQEEREEGLTSLSTWLEGVVDRGHLRQANRKQTKVLMESPPLPTTMSLELLFYFNN